MKVAIAKMTLEELARLPGDGNRYELIDGDLFVSPVPRNKHQIVSGNLFCALSGFVQRPDLGRVYYALFDVYLEPGAQTCVQPDLVFISKVRMFQIKDEGCFGPPDLVVEILSESTRRADLTDKLELHRRSGVAEYWAVEPEDEYFLVYCFAESSTPRKLTRNEVLATPLLPGLEIPLASAFKF